MTQARVLIVDDEPDIRELLDITLSRMSLETRTADSLKAARSQLADTDFQLVLTDMNLPDGNGIDLVSQLQETRPDLPVAVITAYGSMETAINALKSGAFDFISKPVDLARLRELIANAIKVKSPSPRQSENLKNQLLGQSPAIEKLRGQIKKLARSQAPVYISGESGSGKERVARMIHEQGHRNAGPFIAVNCGAIPAELVESEFFGHAKGSFTGASEKKQGLFQAADGGTLFLDEVADLPLSMQVKLLRAIQEKAVRPVGESAEIPIDIRLLSATHKDLSSEVDNGRFRQDLFYRINVIELKVPPLRQRKEDIPLLTENYLTRLAKECEMESPQLSQSAIEKLNSYDFPGNVRELENILERSFTLCDSSEIDAHDILLPESGEEDESEETLSMLKSPSPNFKADDEINLESYLEGIEKQAIESALEETRWNKTAAAKKLGISFRALRYRLKKLGMD